MSATMPLPSVEHNAPGHASFAQGIRTLLHVTQGLPIAGWEVSCRIAAGGVSSDRLLLGFPLQGVAKSRLCSLAHVLGMPPSLADEFQRDLALTAQILLAVESSAAGLEMRAYQSFQEAALGMRGFKWIAQDPRVCRVTEYSREAQTWPTIVNRYQSQAGLGLQTGVGLRAAVFDSAARIADLAGKTHTANRAVEFFSVKERSAQRASTCVRLYETGLRFTDVKPVVSSLLAKYQLGDQQSRLEGLMASRPLGWLAVGEDSNGIPFLTLYGEASLLDARRFMVSGAGK